MSTRVLTTRSVCDKTGRNRQPKGFSNFQECSEHANASQKAKGSSPAPLPGLTFALIPEQKKASEEEEMEVET
jgi:hypothetical protein